MAPLVVHTKYVILALDVIELGALACLIVALGLCIRRLRDVIFAIEETREAQNLTQTTLEEAVEARRERWAKVDGECDENDRLRGHGG